ncbi:MAG TPA: biopolymer transporter ExbD [Chroococcales cyanobacterium]|jgi:biopolymer transport protein ExbD
MKSASSEENLISEINVTPLVDISLVLLIIFMITSYLIAQPSMKVALPRASNTEATQAQTFGITLTKEKSLFLNDRVVSEKELRETLLKKTQAQPDLQVVLSADQTVSHGDVIHLLDLVRGAGVSKIAFSVDAK